MTLKSHLAAVLIATLFFGSGALADIKLDEQPSFVKTVIDSLILEDETIYRIDDNSYKGAGYIVYLSSNMIAPGGRRFHLQYSEEGLKVEFESKWLASDHSRTKTIHVLAPINLSAAMEAVNEVAPLLKPNEWISGIKQHQDTPLGGNKFSLEPVEGSYRLSTWQVGGSGGRVFLFKACGDSISEVSHIGVWRY